MASRASRPRGLLGRPIRTSCTATRRRKIPREGALRGKKFVGTKSDDLGKCEVAIAAPNFGIVVVGNETLFVGLCCVVLI